jgi:23S rRNA pseudouridine2605 synthase
MESLVRFLSRVGEFSRRQAESLIHQGRIKINDHPAPSLSVQIGPNDVVTYDGAPLRGQAIRVYIALNKPDGYISDLKDPKGRKLARNLIKHDLRLFPVGRLDYHSEGLMIFTNDGDLANEVMHPSHNVTKEYLVKFKGLLDRDTIGRMRRGIVIDGAMYKADTVRLAKRSVANAWYTIVVNEGKNRMIRKMGEALGHPVLKLIRVRIGKLGLQDLKPGEYRHVERADII